MKLRKSAIVSFSVVGLALLCAVAGLARRPSRPRHAPELDPLWVGARIDTAPPWCEFDDEYGSQISCGTQNLYKIGDGASTFASYQPRVAIIRQMPTLTYITTTPAKSFCSKAKSLIDHDPSWKIESIDDEFFTATKSDKSGQPVLELFVSGNSKSTSATLYEPLAPMPDWQLWLRRHLHL